MMTTLAVDGNQDGQRNLHPHQPPHFFAMQQPETAKNVHVYLNGDSFFPGRKFVVNKRHICDFNGFLNQVTAGMKAPFGAVRNIYTPSAGHRVQELGQLQNNMDLVAGGSERFRKLHYKEIHQRRRPAPRRTIFELPHHNRMNVSARWRKYVKDPCQIYVYGNGDEKAPAVRLLLIPRMMNSLDLVLSEITEKISLRTGKAVRRLYDVTYKQINDPSQLTQGQYYIAVGTEQLKKLPYGELNSMQKSQSPRRGNALPPIKRHRPRPPQKDGDDQTYTKLHNQRKQQKQEDEETTVMGASAVTGYRPLKTKKYKPKPPASHPTHEGESVFHAKPVKVKRSGKMNHIPHPPSAESDGVFRANGEGIRAEEVQEDEDTKVDLPIDQVPADAVDEEEIQDHPNADANGNDDVDEDVTVDVAASNADEYREKDVGNESDGGFDDNVATEEDNSAPVPTAAPIPLPITNIEDEVMPEDELVQEKPEEIVESEPVEDLEEVPAENSPQNDAVKATEESEVENEVPREIDDQNVGEDLSEKDLVDETIDDKDAAEAPVEAVVEDSYLDKEETVSPEPLNSHENINTVLNDERPENVHPDEFENEASPLSEENEVPVQSGEILAVPISGEVDDTADQQLELLSEIQVNDTEASEVEDTNNKTNDEEQNIAVAPVPVADIEDEVDQAITSQVAPTTPEIVPTVSEIFPDTTAPETLSHDKISPEPVQDLNAEPVADDVPRPAEDVSEEYPKPSSDPVETIPTDNEANDTNNKDVLDGTKEDLESESLNPTEKTAPNDEQQENRPVTPSSPAPAEEALISFDGNEGQMLNSEEMQRSSADGEAIKSTENANATPDVVTEDAIPLDDNGNIDESLKTTLHEPTARPASDALTVDDEPAISNSAELKQIPNGSAQGVEVPP